MTVGSVVHEILSPSEIHKRCGGGGTGGARGLRSGGSSKYAKMNYSCNFGYSRTSASWRNGLAPNFLTGRGRQSDRINSPLRGELINEIIN